MFRESVLKYDAAVAATVTAAAFAWSALTASTDRVGRLQHYFHSQYTHISGRDRIPMRWPREVGLWHDLLQFANSGLSLLVVGLLILASTYFVLRMIRAADGRSKLTVPALILAAGWMIFCWQTMHLPGAYEL